MLSSIKAQYDELNAFGRFFFALGVASLFVAAAMTFKFGWSMSVLHALGLGVLSIVASFLPEAAYRLGEDGHKGLAMVLAILCAPLLAVEYFSHVGYTVGQRVSNVEQTSVHNVKFDDTRASLESDRSNLDLWKKQLADLTALAPWAPTVKAEALRGELEAKAKAVQLEEKRGGCGKRCQKLMEEKGDLEKRIGMVEQAADLTARIEATQRIIDAKTKTASETTFESSPVVNQTAFVAKMIAWDLAPGEGIKEGSQIGISAALALANVLLTPLCFLVAGRSRRRETNPTPRRAMTETHEKVADRMEQIKPANSGHTFLVSNRNDAIKIWEDALRAVRPDLRPAGA